MPRSEIDDIFASTKKSKSLQPPPKPAAEVPKKKKKSSKKRRHDITEPTESTPLDPPAKRRIPETVFDPSQGLAAPSKRSQTVAASEPPKKKKKASRDDELRFKDSRGTGPSRSPATVKFSVLLCNTSRIRADNRRRLFRLQRRRARHHRPGRRYVSLLDYRILTLTMNRYAALSVRLPMLCVFLNPQLLLV